MKKSDQVWYVLFTVFIAGIFSYTFYHIGRVNGEVYIDQRSVIESKVCTEVFMPQYNMPPVWEIVPVDGYKLYSCRDVK